MNRQKYLAELEKLLGFMSSWDRAAAIKKYNEDFDRAESEAELIAALGTPTKQAIAIARDYVPTERPAEPEVSELPVIEAVVPTNETAPVSEEVEKMAETVENTEPEQQSEVVKPVENVENSQEKPAETGAVFDRDTDIDPEMMNVLAAAVEKQIRQEQSDAAAEEPAPVFVAETEPIPAEVFGEEPVEKGRRVRPVALTFYSIAALIIGLPVAVVLIFVGIPFALIGAAVVVGAVMGVMEIIPLLNVFADTLMTLGGGMILGAVGLLLLWLGLWLSIELGSLWIGGVVFRLGGRLCFRKEG